MGGFVWIGNSLDHGSLHAHDMNCFHIKNTISLSYNFTCFHKLLGLYLDISIYELSYIVLVIIVLFCTHDIYIPFECSSLQLHASIWNAKTLDQNIIASFQVWHKLSYFHFCKKFQKKTTSNINFFENSIKTVGFEFTTSSTKYWSLLSI